MKGSPKSKSKASKKEKKDSKEVPEEAPLALLDEHAEEPEEETKDDHESGEDLEEKENEGDDEEQEGKGEEGVENEGDEHEAKEIEGNDGSPSTPLKASSKAKAKAKAKAKTKAKSKGKGKPPPKPKTPKGEKNGNENENKNPKEKPKTLRMQVSSWSEALEESKDEGDELQAALTETRDRQKAQKLAKLEKAGTLPKDVKEALEQASKSENPRATKTMLINRLFKKENDKFILQPNDPSFQRLLKHLDEKFGKEQNTSYLDSI